MFRSKQLHKIHIFKHSRNFSQSQQYNENQAAIRIIKHTKQNIMFTKIQRNKNVWDQKNKNQPDKLGINEQTIYLEKERSREHNDI